MQVKQLTTKFGLRYRLANGKVIIIPKGYTTVLEGTHFSYEGHNIPYAAVRYAVVLKLVTVPEPEELEEEEDAEHHEHHEQHEDGAPQPNGEAGTQPNGEAQPQPRGRRGQAVPQPPVPPAPPVPEPQGQTEPPVQPEQQ